MFHIICLFSAILKHKTASTVLLVKKKNPSLSKTSEVIDTSGIDLPSPCRECVCFTVCECVCVCFLQCVCVCFCTQWAVIRWVNNSSLCDEGIEVCLLFILYVKARCVWVCVCVFVCVCVCLCVCVCVVIIKLRLLLWKAAGRWSQRLLKLNSVVFSDRLFCPSDVTLGESGRLL